MTRKLLVLGLLLMLVTGCSSFKEWVVTTARDTAVEIANEQLSKLHTNKVVPVIEEMELRLNHKVDKDGDELWSEDELLDMIKLQAKDVASVLFTSGAEELSERISGVEGSTEELSGQVDNLPTKKETITGLISLGVIWLLAKLTKGKIKFGKQGVNVAGLFGKKEDEKVDLS